MSAPWSFPNEPETEVRPQSRRRAPPSAPITFYRGDDYRRAPARQMVVKGLMGAGELTFTHGAAKSGKSFLMTSLSLAVAEGVESWWGHRIKRPGQVLYLVQEGAGGFPTRLEAWSQAHGRSVPARFVWTPTRLRFVAEGTEGAAVADVQRVAQLVEHLEEETGEPVVLIVVDTAARVTTGADENSARDMGLFLAACAALQDLPNRPHVNVVAHDNTGGRLRGSTAQLGGGDGFIHVERQGDARSWCLEIAKDDIETDKRGFRLETVDLGLDEDGDPVRSCVVVEAEAPAKPARDVALTPKQKLTLDCLATALADHGEDAPHAHDIPRNTKAVRFAWWQDAVNRYLSGDAPDWRKRQDLQRTAEALQAKGLVRHVDGWCWLPTQTTQRTQDHTLRAAACPHATTQRTQHPVRDAWLRGGVREDGA